MQKFSNLILKTDHFRKSLNSFQLKFRFKSNLITPISEALELHGNSYEKLIEVCNSDEGNQIFWAELAKNRIDWYEKFTKVSEIDFQKGINRWFINGKLNASVNCLDRHAIAYPERLAVIWEKDEPGNHEFVTYKELLELTCRISNLLKEQNVKKHDVVILYMPTSPMLIASMLACVRIGAAHSVIFSGFSPNAIASRIMNTKAKVIITTDESVRGGKVINLKKNIDDAIKICPPNSIDSVLVQRRTNNPSVSMGNVDICMEKNLPLMPNVCKPEIMDSEDMLYILYTSGSSGPPKGIVHNTAGYLLFAGFTFEQVFNFKPGKDLFGCVADIGWVTGHSYIVYGPLFNGGTTFTFESTPTYPNPGRYWEMVERLKMSHIYLAPTALRLLIQHGEEWVRKYDRSSLRVLGCDACDLKITEKLALQRNLLSDYALIYPRCTGAVPAFYADCRTDKISCRALSVGEPLNTEAWKWYNEVVGENRCDIIDTWWQTETGGIIISPRPSGKGDQIRPGMPMRPLPGIDPALIDLETNKLITEKEGYGALVLKRSWPGIAKTIFGDHSRFVSSYFKRYPGYYFTGDGSHRYLDNSYQITGRIDDVINTSGHRIGTAELEDILDMHECVSESAVVGFPHSVKGEGIYAFITLKNSALYYLEKGNEKLLRKLTQQLKQLTREKLAHYAAPDFILITPGLPKTRSGKIMRRILRKISSDNIQDLGDISTLSNPDIVEFLILTHKKIQEN